MDKYQDAANLIMINSEWNVKASKPTNSSDSSNGRYYTNALMQSYEFHTVHLQILCVKLGKNNNYGNSCGQSGQTIRYDCDIILIDVFYNCITNRCNNCHWTQIFDCFNEFIPTIHSSRPATVAGKKENLRAWSTSIYFSVNT